MISAERKAEVEILVQFRPTISDAREEAIVEAEGGDIVAELPQIDVQIIRVAEDELDSILAALNADPTVEWAEANGTYELARTPNDPYYPSQWSLPRLGLPAAWDRTTGSTNTVIAIIDSGVNINHVELAGTRLQRHRQLRLPCQRWVAQR